jgi:hypothetical protein
MVGRHFSGTPFTKRGASPLFAGVVSADFAAWARSLARAACVCMASRTRKRNQPPKANPAANTTIPAAENRLMLASLDF